MAMSTNLLELFNMVKRFFGIALSGLLISGCAFNTDLTIGTDGSVTGTVGFAIPKSVFPKVTSVEQWSDILRQNNVTSPTPDPTPTESAVAPVCLPGEDLLKSQWTYVCEFTGLDVSFLTSETLNFSNIKFARSGNSVTISTGTTSPSSGLPIPVDSMGIKGLSLAEYKSSITIPGVCSTESTSGVTIEEGLAPNTQKVSFTSDTDSTESLSVTCVMDSLVSPPTASGVTLSIIPGDDNNGAAPGQIILRAEVTPAESGRVTFFDGETSLGESNVEDGKASLVVSSESGSHEFRAEFAATDWWKHDSGEVRRTISLKSFTIKSKPVIKGFNKIGTLVKVTGGTISPKPAKISYVWLRNGLPIQAATKSTYKVTSRDRGKRLSVQLTFKGTDTLAKFIVLPVKTK